MALTAAILLVVSVLLFGTGTLQAFLHNVGFISGLVESGRAALARIPTVFAMTTLVEPTQAKSRASCTRMIKAKEEYLTPGGRCGENCRAAIDKCVKGQKV